MGIYCSLTNSSLENSIINFSGKNFSDFKQSLTEVLVEKIEPISQEIRKLKNDSEYLNKVLNDGFEKANEIASKKLKKIHEILGF